IEWAESPPSVAEQFEMLVVMAVHGAAVCDVGGARCPSRSTRGKARAYSRYRADRLSYDSARRFDIAGDVKFPASIAPPEVQQAHQNLIRRFTVIGGTRFGRSGRPDY